MIRIPILILLIALTGCSSCQRKKQDTYMTQEEIDARLMEINKEMMTDESKMIDRYVKKAEGEFESTGTGLRIQVNNGIGTGPLAIDGQTALVHYTVLLLDGTLIRSSRDGEPRTFKIAGSDVESGLHEGITYMRPGDTAIMVLPSHLAYGLAGDQDKIPLRSPIVYEVELIALK